MTVLKIKKLHPDAIVPQYQTAGAACFDLHAVIGFDDVESELPHQITQIDVPARSAYHFETGLALEVPPGWALMIYSRSGQGFKHATRLVNCVGVIDSDYRGEVKVGLSNDGGSDLRVRHGDRIAQAMLVPVQQVTFELVDELTDTARGSGGFGSTGDA